MYILKESNIWQNRRLFLILPGKGIVSVFSGMAVPQGSIFFTDGFSSKGMF
jgi:hypothetical protein